MDLKTVELRPVRYPAVQVTEENAEEVREWCRPQSRAVHTLRSYVKFMLHTGFGGMEVEMVQVGDWILDNGHARFSYVSASDFEERYVEHQKVVFGNGRTADTFETVYKVKPGMQWDENNYETFGEK